MRVISLISLISYFRVYNRCQISVSVIRD